MSLNLVLFENSKQEVEHPENKLLCAEQIEKTLRKQFDENQLKLKAYKNSTELMNACCKRTNNEKVGIGFNYTKMKKKKVAYNMNKGMLLNKEVPLILQRDEKPIFKKSEVEFDEESMLIKQQLNDEDEVTKDATTNFESKLEVKINVISEEITKIKIEKADSEIVKKDVVK